MAVKFPGDDPERTIRKLASLASDLQRIRLGAGPTAADLANAPLIDRWLPGLRPVACLAGVVRGHPLLGDRPAVATTEIFAIDPVYGWARSFTRFYRLGATAEERAGGGNG